MHFKKLLYSLFITIIFSITHPYSGQLSGPQSPEYLNSYKVPSIGQMLCENICINGSTLTQQSTSNSCWEPFNPTKPAEPLSISERLSIMAEPFFNDEGTFYPFVPIVALKNKLFSDNNTLSNHKKMYESDEQSISFEQPLTDQQYIQELQSYCRNLDAHTYPEPFKRAQERLETIKIYEQDNYERVYYRSLPEDVSQFMDDHSFDVPSFTTFKGTGIQHQLHKEIISVVTTRYTLEQEFRRIDSTPLYTDLVIEGLHLAQECNQSGQTTKGFLITDYCGWLNEAEYPYLTSIIKNSAGTLVGAAEGVAHIAMHAIDAVKDPVNTIKDLGTCLFYAGRFLTRATGEIAPLALHCMLHQTLEMHQLNPEFQKSIDHLKELYTKTIEHLESLPQEERARELMAHFTEFFFTRKVMTQVGAKAAQTLHYAKAGSISLAHKLELYKYKALSQTYQRANAVLINGKRYVQTRAELFLQKLTSQEYALIGADCERFIIDAEWTPAELTHSNESALTVFNTASSITKGPRSPHIIKPSALKQSNLPSSTSVIDSTKSAITHTPQTVHLLQKPGYLTFKQELPTLRAKFDKTRKGWGPMKDKYLKIDYEHILDADPTSADRLKGLHHDYLGHYEENGILILENRFEGPLEAYSGRPRWNGAGGSDKTFFPKHWTREEVIRNILEAYDEFVSNNPQIEPERNGKYEIFGHTKSGLKIEMTIDQKCNLITAYPII